MPEITAALDSMLEQHGAQIGPVVKIPERWMLLVQKVRDQRTAPGAGPCAYLDP
jgi:hypothetical protein